MTTGTDQSPLSSVDTLKAFVLDAPAAPPIGKPGQRSKRPARYRPMHSLYSASELIKLRHSLNQSSLDSDSKVLQVIEQLAPRRRSLKYGTTPGASFFTAARARFPHMQEPIELFADMAGLSSAASTGYHVPPILLEGPPGIGKTALALALARAIGTRMEVIDMAGLSAGFLISGSHPSWSASKQGRIFDLLTDADAFANPVVVLDELDKVTGDKRYDPCGSLYTLLEPASARAFKDEFVPLPIDASAIIWIGTCNRAADVPPPLLSRFERYYIDYPDAEAWASIAQSIWTDLLNAKPKWAKILAPTLADNVIRKLVQLSDAREISRVLMRAAARAASAGRVSLIPEDVAASRKAGTARRHPIGFT